MKLVKRDQPAAGGHQIYPKLSVIDQRDAGIGNDIRVRQKRDTAEAVLNLYKDIPIGCRQMYDRSSWKAAVIRIGRIGRDMGIAFYGVCICRV